MQWIYVNERTVLQIPTDKTKVDGWSSNDVEGNFMNLNILDRKQGGYLADDFSSKIDFESAFDEIKAAPNHWFARWIFRVYP